MTTIKKIGQSMAGVNGVLDVHDRHVWSICAGYSAPSARTFSPSTRN